jgi:hypothetical protein
VIHEVAVAHKVTIRDSTVAQTYQVVFGNLNFSREIFFDNPGFVIEG